MSWAFLPLGRSSLAFLSFGWFAAAGAVLAAVSAIWIFLLRPGAGPVVHSPAALREEARQLALGLAFARFPRRPVAHAPV